MWNKIKPYVIFIGISLGIGGLSAVLTKNNMNIYQTIKMPPLSPPPAVFPIVWGILYILMGIGAAIVFKHKNEKNTFVYRAVFIFGLQLAVNFFWSIIFFNMQAYLFAFIWLILLWILIIWMIVNFRKVSALAAYLQLPYLAWVTFAGYLTFMVYLLNR